MKTDVTTPGSFAQSQAQQQVKDSSKKTMGAPLSGKTPVAQPDYLVELSGKKPAGAAASNSVGLPSLTLPSPSLPPAPSIPSSPSTPSPTLESVVEEKIKDEAKDKVTTEVAKAPAIKEGSLKKPAIIFIKGLDVFSSPLKSESGYAGVGRIAETVEGSRIYGWDQKAEIMDQIKKVHPDYPVILVGHSFGGDTAVEVANELDSLGQKFRSVDLLITIDAVGFNNDIIPQNVKKHLNVFGETSGILNDGPHVARRHEKTHVKNILSPLDHTDIDDDKEIQFEIVNYITEALKSSGASKRT